MELQALRDCLIVQPEIEKHALIALIRAKQTGFGIVLAAGPEATEAKVGDRILFGEFVGQELHWEGDDLLVMREEHILGVCDEVDA